MQTLADYQAQRVGPNADYYTPEQRIGAYDDQTPWETCMTLGTQWSWKPDDQIKSSTECLHILITCASGDGNLLFNVGPMPTGEIEPRQVQRLKEMGEWLGKYGESIYGTRGGPFRNGAWGGATRKDKNVYLHVLKWENDPLELPPLAAKIVSATVLTGGKAEVAQDDKHVIVQMPVDQRDKIDTIIKLEVE
jgi:alpha-L-fucosidase